MDEIDNGFNRFYFHDNWSEFCFGPDSSALELTPVEVIKAVVDTSSKLLILNFSKTVTIHPQVLLWIEQLVAYADAKSVRVRAYIPKNKRIGRLLKLMHYDRFLIISSSLEELLEPNFIRKIAF